MAMNLSCVNKIVLLHQHFYGHSLGPESTPYHVVIFRPTIFNHEYYQGAA